MKKIIITAFSCIAINSLSAQDTLQDLLLNNKLMTPGAGSASQEFIRSSALIDASLYSLNALHALVKKEHYRNKIASFNNPASSDLGFDLEMEIHRALKPILSKTKNTSSTKFNDVIRSFITTPAKGAPGKALLSTSILYQTLFSLVGTVALSEKRVMKEDVDSFLVAINKYFVQYEKLDLANETFNESIIRVSAKLEELQFDIREHILDQVCTLHKNVARNSIRSKSLELLQIQYLDPSIVWGLLERDRLQRSAALFFPPDALKSAKEIAYGIQKLFNEYQKIYDENYKEINGILLQSRTLGKNINIKQLDDSVRELESLYRESKQADAVALRLNTLFNRVDALVAAGQPLK